MKRFQVPTLVATAAIATAAFVPVTAHADDRCARPSGSVDERACAMAAAGPETLRRFIERTRGIYGLYYFDYVPRDR